MLRIYSIYLNSHLYNALHTYPHNIFSFRANKENYNSGNFSNACSVASAPNLIYPRMHSGRRVPHNLLNHRRHHPGIMQHRRHCITQGVERQLILHPSFSVSGRS